MAAWKDAEKPRRSLSNSAALEAQDQAPSVDHANSLVFAHQLRAASVAWAATPAFLIPASFSQDGIRGLLNFSKPYPTCDPDTLELPRFLPHAIRQALGCRSLLLILVLAIAIFWAAIAHFFIVAYRRSKATGQAGARDSHPRRDLVMVTLACLLIAYAGSIRDPAVLFLIICPIVLNVHTGLCIGTELVERQLCAD